MGYDMYWEQDSGRDEYHAAIHEAIENKRDLRTIKDPDGYFRLNISGMGQARHELYEAGVVIAIDTPPFPVLHDFGLSDWPEEDEKGYGDQELLYLEAVEMVLTGVAPGDQVGIPAYKLGSNDGWLVTPAEIRLSLGFAQHRNENWRQELSGYVNDFVSWMVEAENHGGFRVY